MNPEKLLKRYASIAEIIPEKGVELRELTKAIIIKLGVISEPAVKRHIQAMELLGTIIKDESKTITVWKPKFIHGTDFSPARENSGPDEDLDAIDRIIDGLPSEEEANAKTEAPQNEEAEES